MSYSATIDQYKEYAKVQIRRLDVTGFKSFSSKKSFTFTNGISAIVGPNGSGKSNIADAIRWVFGEQKTSKLRVAKQEDVIFFGTQKTPRASLAEVSILLDNNTHTFPLDAAEIVISRKLFRSGESEYRINGRKTKKLNLEELLAKSGFGVQSYTVVGQGMIDQLLTATGPERKLLFEEASGIRQYDIRRLEAKRNLKAASENLEKINVVIEELAPTMAIMQKQAQSQTRAKQLLKSLDQGRQQYIAGNLKSLERYKKKTQEEIVTAKQVLLSTEEKILVLHKNNDHKQVTSETDQLKSLELQRDTLNQKLLVLQTQHNTLKSSLELVDLYTDQVQKLDSENTQLSKNGMALHNRHDIHSKKIAGLQSKIDTITTNLTALDKSIHTIQSQLRKNQNKEFVRHAQGMVQTIRIELRKTGSRKEIDTMLHKLSEMLVVVAEDDVMEQITKLNKLQHAISKLMSDRDDITEAQTKEVIILRSIELDQLGIETAQAKLSQQSVLAKKESKVYTQDLHASELLQENISKLKNDISKLNDRIDKDRKALYQATSHSSQDTIVSKIDQLASLRTREQIKIEELSSKQREIERSIQELNQLAKRWFDLSLDSLQLSFASRSVPTLKEIEKLETELEAIQSLSSANHEDASSSIDRMEFLQLQQKDLQASIDDTNKLITSLQRDIKKQFDKSFIKINKAFARYFDKLFSGGTASLELVQTDSEYGVDIMVNPPGKRSKNISALSGGEKAMASIALLAAILTTNPSPFIVLDEVDAALDDENSHRFTSVLQELANHSQLIIITHNHETMQVAQNIFGITTTSRGESEVLSFAVPRGGALANNKMS